MHIKLIFLSIGMLGILSCETEITGPETGCTRRTFYDLGYHQVRAARAYDVRTNPPTRLVNGSIEYGLAFQWGFKREEDPLQYPYNEYFLDSIGFATPSLVNVQISGRNIDRMYDYVIDDCQIELESPDGNLHLELTESGEEISESRFAVFDYRTTTVMIDTSSVVVDTFLFVEFRLGHFFTYEEIAQQFARDHPGEYDTISIQKIENRTRE